jgi:hypothetical protein
VLGAICFCDFRRHGAGKRRKTPKEDTHKFNKAEYFQGTTTGQKKAGSTVKGTLFFDSETKHVNFLQESGSPAVTFK